MTYDAYIQRTFPRDVVLTCIGLVVPLMVNETFLAFDADQKLWAYTSQPAWSRASQKWIPAGEETPRHIITWKGAQVNAFFSIECYPVN